MYREHILELSKKPHNKGMLEHPDLQATQYNPTCGDTVHLTLKLLDDKVVEARFQGEGCAISTAASSLLTDHLKGKTLTQVKKLTSQDVLSLLGIEVSAGRLKCALLCFQALKNATEGEHA